MVNYAGLVGLVASFFSIIYAYSRQTFALSRAGYLPRALSVTNSRKAPVLALLVPVRSASLLSLTGQGAMLLNMAVFGATVSYVLMMVSHIVLRRREPDLPRPYRTPGRDRHHRYRAGAGRAAVVATFLVDPGRGAVDALAYAVFLPTSRCTAGTTWSRPRPRRSSRRWPRPTRSCGDGPARDARRDTPTRSPALSDLMAKATPARSGRRAGRLRREVGGRAGRGAGRARRPAADHLPGRAGGRVRGGRRHPAGPGHLDAAALAPVRSLTVGELREWLLSRAATGDEAAISGLARGLTPEMVAATSKLMRNADLIAVGRRARVVTGLRSTLGLPGRLASRLQPNHPTDDPRRGDRLDRWTGCCTAAGTR